MQIFILIIIGLWFWLGNPKNDVANWFYSNEPAPWETVDAFYYPNNSNLSDYRVMSGLSDAQACRSWVSQMAALNGDPNMQRSSYECGAGKPTIKYGLNVYRITFK